MSRAPRVLGRVGATLWRWSAAAARSSIAAMGALPAGPAAAWARRAPRVFRDAPLLAVPGLIAAGPLRGAAAWLRASRLGLAVMALVVGGLAGLGAYAFRWLISELTQLATGYMQFGQQGRVPSLHLPWLGIWFVLLLPVVGGLIYGPLIQRFAREARGHGVPEVMLAVAENGGRIRPQVTVVKALASALCIGVGGSVGREGPIVQIGSAMASTLGQVVRMSETRMRILVACGAAGGISATFNAPLTGLFFGFEIVLREFSLDAIFATLLASVTADLVSQAFFGSGPFFSGIPHDLAVPHVTTFLLIALLAVLAGVVGVGFKTVLYRLEDGADRLWRGRPEWARPAVGGVALGLLLLAIPQLYGVGYPVIDQAVAGQVVLGMLLLLVLGKVLATSLTLAIGGSGGVFAPSLFIGSMTGMAFGVVAQHLFGPGVGAPAIFALVGMAAVFGAAAQAPLTSMSSVVEMTGNFGLILPVMLGVGIATALSKRLSYGSIYTTKLLRRGIDIERPTPTSILRMLTVADIMQPLPEGGGQTWVPGGEGAPALAAPASGEAWAALVGQVAATFQPQALLADEALEQALRQLTLYGRVGLPVLSPDRQHLRGWVTRRNVIQAMADQMSFDSRETERGTLAADLAGGDPGARVHRPRDRLEGYEILEIVIRPDSPALDRRIEEISWPPGCVIVAATERREVVVARPDLRMRVGERVIILAPAARPPAGRQAVAGSGAARR